MSGASLLQRNASSQAAPRTAEAEIQCGGISAVTTASSQLETLSITSQEESNALELCIPLLYSRLQHTLLLNDILRAEDGFPAFTEEGALMAVSDSNLREAISYTDAHCKDKTLSAAQWVPNRKDAVAFSYMNQAGCMEGGGETGVNNQGILIWSSRELQAECILMSPSAAICFAFNPYSHHAVAGGCASGQVVLWDLSSEEHTLQSKSGPGAGKEVTFVRHTRLSTVDSSHRCSVSAIQWLPSLNLVKGGRTSMESGMCNFFATSSADSQIQFWDARGLSLRRKGQREHINDDADLKPFLSVDTHSSLSIASMLFGTKQMALLGCRDGRLALVDCFNPESHKNPEDSNIGIEAVVEAHSGAIVSLQRSPFLSEVVMSIGDWTFAIWDESCLEPLLKSSFAAGQYTAGTWSPTRPGVLFLARYDGAVEAWDLLESSHEPITTLAVCTGHITALAPPAEGARESKLAAADSMGVLHVLEIPRRLRKKAPHEVKSVMNLLGMKPRQ